MTDPNGSNPLAQRRSVPFAGRERGIFDPYAWVAQRNAGLAELNARRKPEDRMEWFVVGEGEKADLRLGPIKEYARPEPYCTPAEAKAILQQYPSVFAREVLASINRREEAERKHREAHGGSNA